MAQPTRNLGEVRTNLDVVRQPIRNSKYSYQSPSTSQNLSYRSETTQRLTYSERPRSNTKLVVPDPTTYPALSATRDSIRLMQLEPPSHDSILRCTTQIYDISTSPRFIALSYEWGSSQGSKDVRINNIKTKIRKNLYDFLLSLQSQGVYDRLWCDVICIDQSNDIEKGHQVQMMGRIYQEATKVCAWLGSVNWNIDPKSLDDLCNFSYWARAWILQEFLLARVIFLVVKCIDRLVLITEKDLLIGFQRSGWLDTEILSSTRSASRHNLMRLLRFRYREWRPNCHRTRPLIELIETFQLSKCFNRKDKIFSLLSLSSETRSQRQDFNVVYDISVVELLFQTLQFIEPRASEALRYADTLADALEIEAGDLEYYLTSTSAPEKSTTPLPTFQIHLDVLEEGIVDSDPCLLAACGDSILFLVKATEEIDMSTKATGTSTWLIFKDVLESHYEAADQWIVAPEGLESISLTLNSRSLARYLLASSSSFICRVEMTDMADNAVCYMSSVDVPEMLF